MKPSFIEIVFFIGIIAINFFYYEKIAFFFRSIYLRNEKRIKNVHGIECPIATRHWPKGYNYMALERKEDGYRALFFDAEPQYANLGVESFWFSNDNYGTYKVLNGIEIPLEAITKWDGKNISLLKWEKPI